MAIDYTPLLVPGELLSVRTAGRVHAGDPVELAGPGLIQRAAAGSLTYLGIAVEDRATDEETTVMVGGTVHEAVADGPIQAGDLLAPAALPGRVTAVSGPGVIPPPTVTAIAPDTGPPAGGDTVTITGTGFGVSPPAVQIGTGPGGNVQVTSNTTLTCTTPPGADGTTVDVTVTTTAGTGRLAGGFTYQTPPPTAPAPSSVLPVSGPAGGGTLITITGVRFTGVTAVTVGAAPVTGLNVVDDTTITCTTAAHAAGAADITVTSPDGTGTLPGSFTYVAAPAVTGVAPATGPALGGTPVTITGTGFTAATQATFAGTPAVNLVAANPTTINCDTPAGPVGGVPVVVTGPGGASAPLANGFTYAPVPGVTGVNPNTGPATGGTPVTVSGTGFTGATGVTFGGNQATNVQVTNATTLTCTTPLHVNGVVDVAVTTPGGTGTGTGVFTYAPPPPALTSSAPNSGTAAGGTPVVMAGTGLTGATSVTFAGTPATGLAVQSATQLTCTTPPGTAGVADVVVTTPNGTSPPMPGGFTYQTPLPPVVTGCQPASGLEAGGDTVVVQGSNMTGATAVTFGGIAASVLSAGAAAVLCDNPPHAAGVVDVMVTTPAGNSGASGNGMFTYTITAADPDDAVPAARSVPVPAPPPRRRRGQQSGGSRGQSGGSREQ